jgi:hypothetical protein
MKLNKILFIIEIILIISIPFLYLIIKIEPNMILDFIWIIAFAQLTKEFIVKIVLKKKYCKLK